MLRNLCQIIEITEEETEQEALSGRVVNFRPTAYKDNYIFLEEQLASEWEEARRLDENIDDKVNEIVQIFYKDPKEAIRILYEED